MPTSLHTLRWVGSVRVLGFQACVVETEGCLMLVMPGQQVLLCAS